MQGLPLSQQLRPGDRQHIHPVQHLQLLPPPRSAAARIGGGPSPQAHLQALQTAVNPAAHQIQMQPPIQQQHDSLAEVIGCSPLVSLML